MKPRFSLLILALASLAPVAHAGQELASAVIYDDEGKMTSIENFDEKHPAYQQLRPELGFELTGAVKALGHGAIVADQAAATANAVSLHMDYQPAFLQRIGVVSIGPSLGIYPLTTTPPSGAAYNDIQHSIASVWEGGAQFMYQARYFREQPLVPVAGYSAEWLHYSLNNNASGNFIAHGPTVGLWLLLNWISPGDAATMYGNTGIQRTYLVTEMRYLSGHDDYLSVDGSSYFFGLRIEL